MERLTRWVLAHRLPVIVAWIALAITGGVLAGGTVDRLTAETRLPDRPGQEANDALAQRFAHTGGRHAPLLLVVTVPAGTTVDDPAVRDAWNDLVDRVTPAGGRNATHADTGGTPLVSADRRTTVALVYPPADRSNAPYGRSLPGIRAQLERARIAGAPVELTGQPVLSGRNSGAQRGPLYETLIGALGALCVLVLVFGSGLAVVPLVTAAAAILTTFLLVRGLTGLTDVSFIAQYLVALIGLGVAIDYALLIVTRWREERVTHGSADAVVRAAGSAGRAVVLSGVTVAISLAALVVLPVPFLRSVGYAGLLIPLVSVAVAVTLLPVLLHTWGDRLDRRRRASTVDSRMWTVVARAVTRRPALSALASGLVLLALAAPALSLRLGQPETATLGGGRPAEAFHRIGAAGLGDGVARPVEVLVKAGDADDLRDRLRGLDGVAGVIAPPDWTRDGWQVIDVWTVTDPSGEAGRNAVTDILDTARRTPEALAGGGPATDADFISAVYGSLAPVLIVVALFTFLVLARTLRSVVLPLKALALNALSTCAAYGVVVLVWQRGHGSELVFDTPAVGAVTVWIPMAVFAFLFGLSMDYEVFILHRVREAHLDLTARGRRDTVVPSVVTGISRTGRLVTSAALILFLAFTALSSVPVTDVRIFATALAAGILIDATVVRGILTPALVTLLGRSIWWFPRLRTRAVVGLLLGIPALPTIGLTAWDGGVDLDPRRELIPGVTLDLRTVETRRGPVEYDLYGAHGPVVLSVHAGLGGADQGRPFASWLQGSGFRILSPSRPGSSARPCAAAARSTSRPTCSRRCSTSCASTGSVSSPPPRAPPSPTRSPPAIPNASGPWSPSAA